MRHRRLNVRLLAWLLGGLAALAVVTVLLHDFQVRRNARALFALAEQSVEKGDLRSALVHLKQYVRLQPNDPEGYTRYAGAASDLAERRGARPKDLALSQAALETALLKSPEDATLRRRLVKARMNGGRFNDAREHLELLIRDNPDDAELQVQNARCLASDGRFAACVQALYKQLGYDSESKTFSPQEARGAAEIDAYLLAAQLLRQKLESPEIADQMMDQLVAMNPKSHRAWLERARYLLRLGKGDAAKADSEEALRLARNDVDVLLVAGEIAADRKDIAQARALLEEAVTAAPTDQRTYQGLAYVEFLYARDPKRALAQVRKGLEAIPDSTDLLANRAGLELETGDLAAARATLAEMEKHQGEFDPDRLRLLAAQLTYLEGKTIEAARELQLLRLRMTGPDRTQDLLRINGLLGKCHEKLGQLDLAQEAYRAVLAIDARQVEARHGLERVSAALQVAPVQSEAGNIRRQVGEIAAKNSDPRAWQQAEQEIDRLARNRKLTPLQRDVLRSEVLLAQGKFQEAAELIAPHRAENPQDAQVWLATANLALRRPGAKYEDVLVVLDRAEQAAGDQVMFRLARGAIYLKHRADSIGDALRELEVGKEKFSQAERIQLDTNLGSLFERAKLRDDARRCWLAAAALQPNDLKIRLRLFEHSLEVDDVAEMERLEKEVTKLLGSADDPVVLFCQAARLASLYKTGAQGRESLAQAQSLIDRALKQRPDWHKLYRLEANLHMLLGANEAAIAALQRAFELGPADVVGVNQLVQLLTEAGKVREAQEALQLLGSNVRPELAAELRLQSGDVEEGVRLAGEAVQADPQNALKHLWHGQVLFRAGDRDQAEKAIRRALDLAPETVQGWLMLVALLASDGEPADAEAALRDAQLAVSEDRLPLLLAQCYEVLGRQEEAEAYYLAAYRARPGDLSLARSLAAFYLSAGYEKSDGVARARAYLNQILSAGEQAGVANLAWARRTSAQMLSASGEYPDLVRARRFIDANKVEGRLRPEDQILLAHILARRPEFVSRRESIRLLEEEKQQRGLRAADAFLLAGQYQRARDWVRCQAQLLEILQKDPDNVQVRAYYAQLLLEQNQTAAAEREIAKIAELKPDLPALMQLRAALLVRQGQGEKAAKLIVDALPDSSSPDHVALLIRAALLLQQLQQYPAAEKLLREYAAQEPKGLLSLAQFLGRHGDVAESFQVLEQTADDRNLSSVVQVALGTLSQRRDEVGDRFDAQVDAWLAKYQQKAGSTVDLHLKRAALFGQQGRHEDEEQSYRHALASQELAGSSRALVINNLAFNLAMRDQADGKTWELMREAIDLIGPTGALLDTRAMVSLSLGRAERAVADLNLAIADEPKPTRYLHLALAQLAAGNKPAAHGALQEAQKQGLSAKDVPVLERQKYERLLQELGLATAANERL